MEDLGEQKVLNIKGFKMFVSHGHQFVPWGDLDSLSSVQRVNDVDLVITGHTHVQSFREHEGVYYINPGSATGALDSFGKYFLVFCLIF